MLLNLLVMQPIDLCNLNCSYCYLPGRQNKKLMSDDILEASFSAVFNSSLVDPITHDETLKILWHSGEPLLAGITFYERALAIIKKHNHKNIPYILDFQTNATPITQSWCDFIKKQHINISVSIDGPSFLHDKYRKNWRGKGSFDLAMRGVELLRKNGIPLRAICVLTKDSLDHPHSLYEFFTDNDFESVGFNVEEQECFNQVSSLDIRDHAIAQKYKNFMSIMFDRWLQDGRVLHIREFNGLLSALKYKSIVDDDHYLPSSEMLAFHILTITKDGDISTFSPELSSGTLDNPRKFTIGNVKDIDSLDDLLDSASFQSQLKEINQGVEMCSQQCDYFDICGGGSASNKFYENGSFMSTQTSVCVLSKQVLTDLVFEKLMSA